MHKPEGGIKIGARAEQTMMRPNDSVKILHQLAACNSDFSATRNHPRHNADAVRENYRTFGHAFPKHICKRFCVKRQNICQRNHARRVRMINHAVLAVCRRLFHAVIKQVARKLACRSAAVFQPPYHTVFVARSVQLRNADVVLGVKLDISHKFSAARRNEIFAREIICGYT